MKILFASAESSAEGYAPEAFTRGLCTELRALNHDVRIYASDTGPYHRTSLLKRLERYLRINTRVISAMGSADAIVSRAHFAHLPWALVAALRGKLVIHIMNGFVHDASTTHGMSAVAQAIAEISFRLQFRLASHVVAVTREIADSISARFRTNGVTVIANGVDTSAYRPAPRTGEGRPYAVYPSSLAPWHDTDTIFAAVANPAWPEDLDVVIVGDGASTELVCARTKGGGRVRYLGLLSTSRLREVMQQAEMGLCLVRRINSRNVNEVYPLKLFEMMACGLPVIVTDLPGQRDVIADSGAGAIVPELDAAALACAVRAIHMRTDREAIGTTGAAYVASRYSWAVGAARLCELITTVSATAKAET